MSISNLKSKRVLIYGLGLQGGGVSAATYFASQRSQVRVTDLKSRSELTSSLQRLHDYPIQYTLGEHREEDFAWADLVIVNPDIFNKARNSTYLALAKKLGKTIQTEMGVFFEQCACPIIGITGTRGKTTTTYAIHHLLAEAGLKTFLGGNIPHSDTLFRVEETKPCDYAVLELSNYQLRGLQLTKRSPQISIVTSIYPDHLISYQGSSLAKKMEAYVEDKRAITAYQRRDDVLIVKNEPTVVESFTPYTQATVYRFDGQTLPKSWHLELLGLHNRENLGAVYQIGKTLSLNEEVIKHAVCSFQGVPYRLEKVGQKNQIAFVNDTTATSPTAAQIALKSFPASTIVWLAGGNSKELPYDQLIATAGQRVKAVAFLDGNATADFRHDLLRTYPQVKDLGVFTNFEQAVAQAFAWAQAGDTILLSPGFTSFGMFENEFDRGQQFNQLVMGIMGR